MGEGWQNRLLLTTAAVKKIRFAKREVLLCMCVCSQPAIPVTKFHVGVMCRCRPLGLLLKHEISYSCKTKTLKLIPQQVRLVNLAFCPHHYLGFMRAFYFGCFISSPSEVLPVCTCPLPQKCPSYANFKINFFL